MSTNQTIAQLQSTDRETVFHPSTHASDHAHGKVPVNIIQSGKEFTLKISKAQNYWTHSQDFTV